VGFQTEARQTPRGKAVEWFQRNFFLYSVIRPLLDIAILSFLLYQAYNLLVKTQAIQLVKGAGLIFLFYGLAFFFDLNTVQWLMNLIAPGVVIALAIVFQPELRKIILRIGQGELFRLTNKPRPGELDAAVTAAEILSQQRRGALVVFTRNANIKNIVETGTRLNAEISSALIITIFAYNGPLHDGALVIQGGRIAAAGCMLPLSEQQDIRKSFGTRHRAALGISEQSDAVILVVSEETGAISLAYDGVLYYDLSSGEAQTKLNEFMEKRGSTDREEKEVFIEQ
jgi:diadenylate cyclase